jgi:hypothetical protein
MRVWRNRISFRDNFDCHRRNATAVFELEMGVRTHFARHPVYVPKELTLNLMVTTRITGLPAVLASTLLAACGEHSTTPSTETLTVYEDKPTLKLLPRPTGKQSGRRLSFFCSATFQPRWSGYRRSIRFENADKNGDGHKSKLGDTSNCSVLHL